MSSKAKVFGKILVCLGKLANPGISQHLEQGLAWCWFVGFLVGWLVDFSIAPPQTSAHFDELLLFFSRVKTDLGSINAWVPVSMNRSRVGRKPRVCAPSTSTQSPTVPTMTPYPLRDVTLNAGWAATPKVRRGERKE